MAEKNDKSWDTMLIDKVLLVIVAVMGAVGLIYTFNIFFVMMPAQNVGLQVFDGLVGVLILQVLLVNTIFIWKIMHKADETFASFRKNKGRR